MTAARGVTGAGRRGEGWVLGSLAVVLAACGSGSAAPSHGLVATIPTGVNPAGVAVGGGFAWVANSGEGTVSKIDLRTNRPVARIAVGDPHGLVGCESGSIHQAPHGDFRIRNCDLPKAVAATGRAVWAGRGDTRSLVRIDPATDRVVASIPVGVEPWYIAASDTAVWLTDWQANTAVRVDPATDRVVATLADLPGGPTGVAIAPAGVWVASSRANTLSRIDALTNRVVAGLATDPVPLPVLYAFGGVWVRNEFPEGSGSVQRFDPISNRMVATIPLGPDTGRDGLDGLAALDGRIWVAGPDLEQIDPASNRVVRRIDHPASAVTAGAGSLWTIDGAHAVSRITP